MTDIRNRCRGMTGNFRSGIQILAKYVIQRTQAGIMGTIDSCIRLSDKVKELGGQIRKLWFGPNEKLYPLSL